MTKHVQSSFAHALRTLVCYCAIVQLSAPDELCYVKKIYFDQQRNISINNEFSSSFRQRLTVQEGCQATSKALKFTHVPRLSAI